MNAHLFLFPPRHVHRRSTKHFQQSHALIAYFFDTSFLLMNLTAAAFILLNYPPGNHWILFAFCQKNAVLICVKYSEIHRPTVGEYPNFIHKCPFFRPHTAACDATIYLPVHTRFNLIFSMARNPHRTSVAGLSKAVRVLTSICLATSPRLSHRSQAIDACTSYTYGVSLKTGLSPCELQ